MQAVITCGVCGDSFSFQFVPGGVNLSDLENFCFEHNENSCDCEEADVRLEQ